MNTDLETTDKPKGLRRWIQQPDVATQLVAAIGNDLDADQFMAHCLVALQHDKLRNCTDESKFKAIHTLAAYALPPTSDNVALIPYKNKGVEELKVMVQWQGMKVMMERHPEVLEVTAHIVHTSDVFAIENGIVDHRYDPFDEQRDVDKPANLRGGYCKITYRDGRPPKYHFVRIKQICKMQKCAQTQSIWNSWYEQMVHKSLYRDTYARRAVPMDPIGQERMEKMLNAEDWDLGNDPSRVLPDATERHIEQARHQRTITDEPPLDGTVVDEKPPVKSKAKKKPAPKPEPTPEKMAKEDPDAVSKRSALLEEFTVALQAARDVGEVQRLEKDVSAAIMAGDLLAEDSDAMAKEVFDAKTRLSQT